MSKKLRFSTAVIVIMVILAALLMMSCSDGASDSSAAGSTSSFTGDKYVSDKGELLTTSEVPDNYEYVPNDTFEKAFKALSDNELSSYADVAGAFGDDGIRMDGNEYPGYTYYAWYSDKDYAGDMKVSVYVTFKGEGNDLTYYAYSSNGILPEDVE